MAAAGEARAEQFVVMDATFTYTWDMAVNSRPSRAHFYVNEGNFLSKTRPTNWLSPIDYRNGTVHIRTEVIEKPAGNQQAGWALCYVANSGGYGCPYTNYYTATGVYDRDVSMKSFFNNATLNWQQGIKQIDLVYTINGSGSGHITNFPNLKDAVTPTKVRITMIQVSAGSTYDPKAAGFTGGATPPPESPPEMSRDGGAATDVAPDPGGGGQGGQSGVGGQGGSDSTRPGVGGSLPPTMSGGNAGVAPNSGGVGGATSGTGGASGVSGTGGSQTRPPSTSVGSKGTVSGGCSLASLPTPTSPSGSVAWLVLVAVAGLARRIRRSSRR
ncbi:MAG TPA: hypothetical protein VGG33_10695 [Polyangia bacterium]